MSNTPPIRVRLWDLIGTGLIVRWPSGIVYDQMIGGRSHSWAEAEGVFVPVGNDVSLDGRLISASLRLEEHFAGPPHHKQGVVHGLSERDADVIEAALHENLLLRNVSVDRTKLNVSCEGWVEVRIDKPQGEFPPFEGLGPFPLSGC
jgi:Family of unknown function (DUF6210)